MSEEARSRISGRQFTVALGCVIALLFAVFIWRFFAVYWPAGPVLFEVAEAGEHAIVVRADDRDHVHVVRVHESEGPLWTQSLFDVPSAHGITSEGGLTTIRVVDHDGHLETHAFDRVTGEFRWRGGRGERPLPEGGDAVAHQTLVWEGHQYEFDAAASEVICLDRGDGSTGWREPTGDGGAAWSARMFEGRVCIHSAGGAGEWCRGPADSRQRTRS